MGYYKKKRKEKEEDLSTDPQVESDNIRLPPYRSTVRRFHERGASCTKPEEHVV